MEIYYVEFIGGTIQIYDKTMHVFRSYVNSSEGRKSIQDLIYNSNSKYLISWEKSAAEEKGRDFNPSDEDENGHVWVEFTWDDVVNYWGNSPTIALFKPSFTQIVNSKRQEIKSLCHEKITEGFSIDLGLQDESGDPLGELHYSLSELNQQDIRDLATMIAAGATQVTWRDDSRVSHMIYTSEQFMKLYNAVEAYILKCRFRSDALEELLNTYKEGQETEAQSLSWGTEIPKDISDRINGMLKILLNDESATI